MIRWELHLIRQAAQVRVPERRPEALCNSVLTPALSQPRSGEAPQAASGAVAPLVPHNSCSQCGVCVSLLFSECGSSRFLKCCQPITLPPPPTRKFQMQTKNNDTATVSTWTPSPGKPSPPLNGSRQGAHANMFLVTPTHPTTTNIHNEFSCYTTHSNTCHTCTQQG